MFFTAGTFGCQNIMVTAVIEFGLPPLPLIFVRFFLE